MDDFKRFLQEARTIPAVADFLDSKEVKRSSEISKRRNALRLTQRDVAERTGLELRTIARVEGADPKVQEEAFVKVYSLLEKEEKKKTLVHN
ncbi:hypothetical protein [Kurthia sp. Dielmo]|uniref:helix-turn-helix domain-containing protein n=1 Tax=Kurthia sp. Dielmo TaxID=1033738 RepID=UPI0011214D3C|nr:hypothetical protein [Kurthia sp. Dielmo]